MRTRKKDKANFIKVGAFVAALTFVLMILIISIGKENSIFDSKVDIKARVPNVSNLKPGSYVELKGIKIGSVEAITIISDEEVEILMTILQKELKWIKVDSKVSISTAGLVGDKFVEIFKGSKSANVFDPEKNVLTSEEATDFKQIMVKGESIATVTDRILGKLDLILTNLGDGKTIVDTMNSLHKTSSHLEKISAELGEARLGETAKNFNKASSSLSNILTRVDKGPGTLNSLIYNDAAYEDLRVLLGGAQRNKVIKYFIRESIRKSEKKP